MPAVLALGLLTTLETHRDRDAPNPLDGLSGALARLAVHVGLGAAALVLFVPWNLADILLADLAAAMFGPRSFVTPLPRPQPLSLKGPGESRQKQAEAASPEGSSRSWHGRQWRSGF
jgi:hypothetical protein